MHHKRKLLIALAVTGALTAGFGTSVFSASAKPRTFVVTFLGGMQRTITVDVGADTPVDQIKLPGIDLPLLSIQEVTPPDAPTTGPITITPGAPAQRAARAGSVGRRAAGRRGGRQAEDDGHDEAQAPPG